MDFNVGPFDERDRNRVIAAVSDLAKSHRIAVILGTENLTTDGRQVAAVVIDRDGTVLGAQTENQLDPTEDAN